MGNPVTRIPLDLDCVPRPVGTGVVSSWKLRTHLYFRNKRGNKSFMVPALVDTGATFTTLPADIWTRLDRHVLCRYEAFGAMKAPQCRLEGHLALVAATIGDHDSPLSAEKTFPVFCVENCRVPPLFGMKDGIDAFRLVVDVRARQAFLAESAAA